MAPDVAALLDIAEATGNIKTVLLDQLSNGVIGVPACVWNEFNKAYEEKAESIKMCVTSKIALNGSYRAGAARAAEQLNSGFSYGVNDDYTDLYAASIASIEGLKLITSTMQLADYANVECTVIDLGEWADEQDP